jgi:hypothetical protein
VPGVRLAADVGATGGRPAVAGRVPVVRLAADVGATGVRLAEADRVPEAGGALRVLCTLRADLVPVAGVLPGPRDTLTPDLGCKGAFLAGGLLLF